MKWLRCRDNGTDTWGWMEGDEAVLVDGSPFGEYRANGRRLPLALLAWLAPCQPSQMLALIYKVFALLPVLKVTNM
jgi:hypothetical protein